MRAALGSPNFRLVPIAVLVVALGLCGCGEKGGNGAPSSAAATSGEQVAATPADSSRTPIAMTSAPASAPIAVTAAPAASSEAGTQAAAASAPAPAAGSATAGTPQELPLLFDQLEKPDYKAAYLALFHDVRVAPWMKEGGTASPGRVMTVGGSSYELYSHCKPHDCGDHMMYVLFSRDHARAWAYAVGDAPTWFGSPDDAMKAFLKAAACKDVQREAC